MKFKPCESNSRQDFLSNCVMHILDRFLLLKKSLEMFHIDRKLHLWSHYMVNIFNIAFKSKLEEIFKKTEVLLKFWRNLFS